MKKKKMKGKLKGKLKGKFSQEWKNIIFNISFSIIAILIVILFYEQILLTAILEAGLGIIGLLKWKSKVTLSIFVLGGVGGTLVEMLIIYTTGAWTYKIPSVLNIVPIWLIFVWGNTSAYLYETGKELKKIIREK
jgi:hypothetical protein